jgi:gliding motility-associated-like protein
MFRKYTFILTFLVNVISLHGQAIDTTSFILPQIQACSGDTIFLPVTTENFQNVRGFQFFIKWDANQLKLIDTCDLFHPSVFGNQFALDQLTLLFFPLIANPDDPVNLPDGDTIITLKFVVLNLDSPASVFFNESPPSINSQVTVNSPISGASAITFRPKTQTGSVSFLDLNMDLQLASSPITCVAAGQISVYSAIPGLNYAWFAAGTLYASTPDTTVIFGGEYTLVANRGTCIDTQLVNVAYDTLAPPLPAIADDTINCRVAMATLSPDFINGSFDYQWIGPAQDTNSGPNLEVATAGLYVLETNNPANGCVRRDTAYVIDQSQSPEISLVNSGGLDCRRDTAYIIALYLDSLSLELEWRDEQGGLATQADTLWISQAGQYFLYAIDPISGCTAVDSLEIMEDRTLPNATIQGDSVLDCRRPSLSLQPDNLPPHASLEWRDEIGNLLSTQAILDWAAPGLLSLLLTDTLNGCEASAAITISSDFAIPQVNLAPPTDTLTCGLTQISLVGWSSAVGLAFQWLAGGQPLSNGPSLNVNEPGFYTLIATDTLNGCDTILLAQIFQDTLTPEFTITGGTLLTCNENAIELNIQSNLAAGQCEWLGIGNNCSTLVSLPDTYIAIVTNLHNQCTALDSVTVTRADSLPPIVAQVEGLINCRDTSVKLFTDNLYEHTVYTWLDTALDTLSTGSIAFANAAGIYTLIASDSLTGCTSQQYVTVEEDQRLPSGQATSPSTLDCDTPFAPLLAEQLSIGVIAEWQDNTGMLLAAAQASQPGTYYLLLTDTLSGCIALDSVEVVADFTLPSLSLDIQDERPVLTCVRTKIELTAQSEAGAAFFWLNAAGDTIVRTAAFEANTPGLFRLLVQSSVNGCTRDTVLAIIENRITPLAEIRIEQDFDCAAEEAVLSAAPGNHYSYEWSGPALTVDPLNTAIATAFETGRYNLEVIDTLNGCSSSTSIELNADPDGIQAVLFAVRPIGCNQTANGSLLVMGSEGGEPPYFYTLNGEPLGSSSQADGLSAGSYALTAIDARGCRFDTTITIFPASGHELSLSPPNTSINLGDSILLAAAVDIDPERIQQISWYVEGRLVCDSCFTFIAKPQTTTFYQVVTIDEDGCTSQAQAEVRVAKGAMYYAPNAFSPNSDGSNDVFVIYPTSVVRQILSFSIYDRWGNQVYLERPAINQSLQGWNGDFRAKPATTGVYTFMAELTLANEKHELISGEVLLLR